MADEQAPIELLKSFPGLILRQALFNPNSLDVDTYHFIFLDQSGQPLANDLASPEFIPLLSDIIPLLSDKPNVLLSIPSSWEEALQDARPSTINITLDLGAQPLPDSRFDHAQHDSTINEDLSANMLLVNIDKHSPDTLKVKIPNWSTQFKFLCVSNINSLTQYQFCKSQPIDLIQGQFYTLPSTKDNQKISPSIQTLMELLVKLQDPDVEADDIAATINLDISLSYKLLRLVNSAFFGLPREVNSIKQTIVILGIKKIKTWASLLGLSGVDDKPVELRIIAMTRARMCELLANHYHGQAELFFTAGLFSTLDALMDSPLDQLVEKLPLSEELKVALLNFEGPAGQALNDVLNYENSRWNQLANSSAPTELLLSTYIEALQWAKELHSQLEE